jgi:hypothetical protein
VFLKSVQVPICSPVQLNSMKRIIGCLLLSAMVCFKCLSQETIDTALQSKAVAWIKSLQLDDAAKEARLTTVVATHLTTITQWNNTHPASTVPAGINPATGNKLSEMDRQIIANSAMPASIHQDLMIGLRKELSEEQVELVLDKYTIGKVAFTMKGYHAIVPNMTAKENSVILVYMKQAREQAVDFKNIRQVSAIFEIYKTKSEQYLNMNGRNWREMYKAYTDKIKAEKAAKKE